MALAAGLVAGSAGGCGGDDGPGDGQPRALVTAPECNPMGETQCLAGWPSALYMVADSTTATGVRIDLPEGALPTNADGYAIDPALFNSLDGFSASAPVLMAFPNSVDSSNLVHYLNYGDSITDASPTVLIDMDSGERVVHFAEIDVPEPEPPGSQTLYLRPAARLRPGTRYAVGIRKTLKDRDGGELPIPEGFQAILDGVETDHALLERARPRYDAIFAAFEAQGIDPRTDLVVAWDFITASDGSLKSWLLAARDEALPIMGTRGANLSYTTSSNDLDADPRIRRKIEGTFEGPLFLTQNGLARTGTKLSFDPAGMPKLEGMYDIPFVAIVPECAYTQGPVPILIYGHGLLGSLREARGRNREAASLCMILVGTEWRGMSQQDIPNLILTLNDLNNMDWIFTTLVQGIVNHITLAQIATGPMAETLFVDDSGQSLVDPNRVYFYGISQGGIFGGTFVAYDPLVERAVLGVGGANYSMMLERSRDWPLYKTTLIGAYPDAFEVTTNIYLFQLGFDHTDPTTTSPGFFDDPIPGTPPKQVLMHAAIGDAAVPNIATAFEARTMGVPVLTPSVYVPWGLETVEGPVEGGSALVFYDEGDTAPLTNEPPDENNAHHLPREQEASFRQMSVFFDTGTITVQCNDQGTPSACNCAAGYCD